jgi:hypothetical protein
VRAGYNDDASVQALAASFGPGIKGKVILDATNPLTKWPELEVRWGQLKSGAASVALCMRTRCHRDPYFYLEIPAALYQTVCWRTRAPNQHPELSPH